MDTAQLMQSAATIPLQLDAPAWHRHAACKGVDVAEFFPGRNGKKNVPDICQLCETCPVAVDCLEYAVADPSLLGWWAGTTNRHRQIIRRQRRQQNAA